MLGKMFVLCSTQKADVTVVFGSVVWSTPKLSHQRKQEVAESEMCLIDLPFGAFCFHQASH